MKIKIWQRYFIKETLKVFFLFLFAFYLLYSVLDYSTQADRYVGNEHIQIDHLLNYYLYNFIKRADILIPLALIVSTIKVLLSLNSHRELVALEASGIPKRKLLTPFLFIAFLCTFFNLASNQWIAPKAFTQIEQFETEVLKVNKRQRKSYPMHTVGLKDGTSLIYRLHDKVAGKLHDVVWVKSPTNFWRFKYLNIGKEAPVAEFADHFVRTAGSTLKKTESHEMITLRNIQWSKKQLLQRLKPAENYSISHLIKLKKSAKEEKSLRLEEISTQIIYKLLAPFLSLIAVLGIAPYCMRYSRNVHAFYILSASIFGFITSITFLEGGVILSENQTTSPLTAIGVPIFSALLFFTYQWRRETRQC